MIDKLDHKDIFQEVQWQDGTFAIDTVEKQEPLWQELLIPLANNIVDSMEVPNLHQKTKI